MRPGHGTLSTTFNTINRSDVVLFVGIVAIAIAIYASGLNRLLEAAIAFSVLLYFQLSFRISAKGIRIRSSIREIALLATTCVVLGGIMLAVTGALLTAFATAPDGGNSKFSPLNAAIFMCTVGSIHIMIWLLPFAGAVLLFGVLKKIINSEGQGSA